ncbi:MAG: hypothetical protein PUH87_07190 [Bacteroidales bacterium]|nr:hypothetical protein [Bacteroidales bacterium]
MCLIHRWRRDYTPHRHLSPLVQAKATNNATEGYDKCRRRLRMMWRMATEQEVKTQSSCGKDSVITP